MENGCAYAKSVVAVWGRDSHNIAGEGMSAKSNEDIHEKLARVGELVAEHKSEDYESFLLRLQEVHKLFHDMLAEQFTEVFNAHLASLPQETGKQKQMLARAANADLRKLGLTIRCPKTNKAAHLRGTSYSPTGSFQLCLTADSSYARSVTSKSLPHVGLMVRSVHGGPNSSEDRSWAKRVGHQSGGNSQLPNGGLP